MAWVPKFIRIFISETGWPNGGDVDEIGANVYNAATYNRNLVAKLTAKPVKGTPARPEVYPVDLSGKTPLSSYPALPLPDNDKPYIGKVWCVVATGANVTDLGPAFRAIGGTCNFNGLAEETTKDP
ncbi:hypothetical protein Droror1_Dr00017881, partial [Drosera rotundifolia]